MKTKRFFISVIAFVFTMVAWAQNNDVATAILQSGENTTVFTGINALVQAVEAAADGDVITLSAGQFYETDITKSVSVIGAGYEADATTGTGVTSIIKNGYYCLSIGKADETLQNVHLEGLRVESILYLAAGRGGYDQKNPVQGINITKCYVAGHIQAKNSITDVAISQCVITGSVTGGKDYLATNLTVTNCHINDNVHTFAAGSRVLVDHCILMGGFYHGNNGSTEPLNNSAFTWTNCIFGMKASEYSYVVGIGATVQNCLCSSLRYGLSGVAGIHENNYEENYLQMVVSFGDYADARYVEGRTFELLNPTWFPGTDGGQIGLLGGEGFSRVPSTPVVKNLSPTVEGSILKISYEAEVR